MENIEKAYSTKEISVTLGIGNSTLRKWCLALEKNGYKFFRNDREQRLFVDSDLITLKHFQQLVQNHNMQLDDAARIVVDRFGKGPFQERTDIVPVERRDFNRSNERSNERMNQQLLEHIRTQEEYMKKQEKFNEELLRRLDQQKQYINKRLDEHDKLLTASLKASLEAKKKESFWSRFFKIKKKTAN